MKMTLIFILIVTCGLVFFSDVSAQLPPKSVSIPDVNLATVVRETLGLTPSDVLTTHAMQNLTTLDAPNRGITNLTGLEHAHNLRGLNLGTEYVSGEGHVNSNKVANFSVLKGLTQLAGLDLSFSSLSDVSLLSGLTQLRSLYLNHNNITDVSALKALTQLTYLGLNHNNITDVSALTALTQLTALYLNHNNITDVSALTALTQLTYLNLDQNNITDVSALTALTQLTYLYLNHNNITDVSALTALTQLTALYLYANTISDVSPLVGLNLTGTRWNSTGLYLERNPLNYASINTHIHAMQAKGIEVKFDPRTPATLTKRLGDAQQGTANAALLLPFVVEVRDQHNLAFAGVPVRFSVITGDGRLSTTSTATDVTGRAEAHLTLGRTSGITTVRVAAAEISQSVQFTATTVPFSSPVIIPDANLRAQIAAALGKLSGRSIILKDMLVLTELTANNADIHELTGLQYASNLTTLSLDYNHLTDIAPLAGLTQLKTLSLNNNSIRDLEPLIRLTHLTTLSLDYNGLSDIGPLIALPQLKTLHVRGNLLSDPSHHIHIPAIQSRGAVVAVDPHAPDSRPIVRLIYFLPRDRQPQPYIDAKIDALVKYVQQFFTDQMEAHGFGRKTFQIETDARGKVLVHRVIGQFDDQYYYDNPFGKAKEEINEQFDMSKNTYFITIEIGKTILRAGIRAACGQGSGAGDGRVIIPASGSCFDWDTAAHELGHAFELQHDFRDDAYIMSYGPQPTKLSLCAAEWLDVHPAFNSRQDAVNKHATFEMLPPSLASPPNAVRLRFKLTDPDGIHHVHLRAPSGPIYLGSDLIGCKRLNGNPSSTLEFITTALAPSNKIVEIQMIDVHGNSSRQAYPIDITSLLPPAKVISIPDPNLAAAIRKQIGARITTHTMPNLRRFYVRGSGITDLTGLEHAHNLSFLDIGNTHGRGKITENRNAVTNFSPLKGLPQLTHLNLSFNSLSDVSFLSELPQLTHLNLSFNSLSDVFVLAGLTQLISLDIAFNSLSDVSVLAGLTQLTLLDLSNNLITDIGPLSGLTQLTDLVLEDNSISNVAPLAGLTKLTTLRLRDNNITDVSILAGLTQLTYLNLAVNSIADISDLGGLTQLTYLSLAVNKKLSDISVLAGLTQLTTLYFGINTISDVSALAGLTQLTRLSLADNVISDVSPLAGLTQLMSLYLTDNVISDVSPLAGLTQLTILRLSNNAVADVSPLTELTQLKGSENWLGLFLEDNPLSYASINTHIPAMQAKGLKVQFDNRTHPTLLKVSGDGQEDTPGATLATPFIVKAMDARGKPMRGVAVTFAVTAGGGRLSTTSATTNTTGKAQTTLTFGRSPGKRTVTATATKITRSTLTFTAIAVAEPVQLATDVNGDGVVNIQDLVLVSSSFGQTGQNRADVNGDGVVNIQDLVLVAGAFGAGATAAPSLQPWALQGLTAAEVQQLLTQARQMALTDPAYLRGVAVLEQLFALLLPKETALLPNYPNPFNPETWIPYQLTKPTEGTLNIYSVDGTLVRTLALGHQPAGMYHSRSRAAYWDGRNEQGERVASGVYFYTLSAEDFTSTRKMLIRK